MSTNQDGSSLCLECGLCCQGIFHGAAKVQTAEISAVSRLGLPIVESVEGPAFALPCPLHQENRCTVYKERPSACSDYRCKLLKRFLAGESTWEESLLRVSQARGLVASLRQRLGPESRSIALWRQSDVLGEEGIAAAQGDQELLLEFASLSVLSRTHFRNRAQPRETFGP
jgi:hypothetical protein